MEELIVWYTDLLDGEVLDLSAGNSLGRVADMLLTPAGEVEQLGIQPWSWHLSGQTIPLADVGGVSNGRVSVSSASGVAALQVGDLVLASSDLIGKSVLLNSGEGLGELIDFSFCLSSGSLCELKTAGPDREIRTTEPSRLLTIGAEYLIVSIDETALVEGGIPDAEQALEHQQLDRQTGAAELPPPEPARKLRPFNQRKYEFLLGRKAHRQITDSQGRRIINEGQELEEAALSQLLDAGLLDAVFLEATSLPKDTSAG